MISSFVPHAHIAGQPEMRPLKFLGIYCQPADEMGVYLDDCQMKRPSEWATDPVKAERLWKMSEEMVGQEFDFGSKKGSRL